MGLFPIYFNLGARIGLLETRMAEVERLLRALTKGQDTMSEGMHEVKKALDILNKEITETVDLLKENANKLVELAAKDDADPALHETAEAIMAAANRLDAANSMPMPLPTGPVEPPAEPTE